MLLFVSFILHQGGECPDVRAPQDGFVDYPTGRQPHSMARFFCDPGYEVVGRGSVQCLASLSWSSSELPTCKGESTHGCLTPIEISYCCGNLISIHKALGSTSANNFIFVVILSLSGLFKPSWLFVWVLWTSTLSWAQAKTGMFALPLSLTSGLCISCVQIPVDISYSIDCLSAEITCPSIASLVQNGRLNITARGVGETAKVVCGVGFYLRNSLTSVCQEDGTWSDPHALCGTFPSVLQKSNTFAISVE